MRLILLLILVLSAAACVPTTDRPNPAQPLPSDPSERARVAVSNFVEVVERVEPVAESICRQETRRQSCDFQIWVDRDPSSGVNAFQTLNRRGQPVIIFTIGMIAAARNQDELAFVMGHEAGHHIAQHLAQQSAQAAAGAELFGSAARSQGASEAEVGEAARIGSLVASRRFSQSAELEADAIGATIAYRAGFDPITGSAFFRRLPNPSDAFLSTHPPNAARIATVRRAVAELRGGST